MQPSAPLTTDWSTSATVPEQTSAWGKGQSQAGSRIYWAWHAQDQGVELSPCSQDTGTQGTRCESASRTAGRQARACARPAAWTTQARACALQSHCRRGHRHTRDMQGVLPEPPKPGARPAAGRGAPADVGSSLRPPPGAGGDEGETAPPLPRPLDLAGARLRPGTGLTPAPRAGGPVPSPAPSPGGRRHRRQTSWAPRLWRCGEDPRCRGARRPGHTGSPASSAAPPSGRTRTRQSAGLPERARPAARPSPTRPAGARI